MTGDWTKVALSNFRKLFQMMPSTAISIPEAGESVTYLMDGMTAGYQLIRWNFSTSAENNPPASLSWSTGAGSFTITNDSGTTSDTIQPVFAFVPSVAVEEVVEEEEQEGGGE